MSRVVRKPAFSYAKTKTQSKLINAFVVAIRIIQFLYYLNPKFQASSHCGCSAWFVWDLVGNPEYQFSHNEAQISTNASVLILL